jgi:hypothetical protein
MKKVLFALAVLAVIVSSCGKDETTDPRDQFVGTFTVTQTVSIPGLSYTDNTTGTYTIKKHSTDSKRIILNDGSMDIMASVDGNTYSYDKFTVTFNDGTNTGTEEVTGEGVMNGNKINETGTINLSYGGKTYGGTWYSVCNRQ